MASKKGLAVVILRVEEAKAEALRREIAEMFVRKGSGGRYLFNERFNKFNGYGYAKA